MMSKDGQCVNQFDQLPVVCQIPVLCLMSAESLFVLIVLFFLSEKKRNTNLSLKRSKISKTKI
jgi:hypothetical protein